MPALPDLQVFRKHSEKKLAGKILIMKRIYIILFYSLAFLIINSCMSLTEIHGNRSESEIIDSLNNEINSDVYPIGGINGMQSKMIYPQLAKIDNIEGKVLVDTWINYLGDVTKTEVARGIGYGCDEEAMRIISLTKFVPAKINGQPVNVVVQIPFIFQLE